MPESPKRIAIIGGGLGGLVLLRILHIHGVPATLYERDVSAEARSHLGGMLDLHEESGQRAMIEAGLEAEFRAHSLPEGDATRIMKASGDFLYTEDPPAVESYWQGPSRPEIDRTTLRRILLNAIPPELVKWDHNLVSASPHSNHVGAHTLKFSNGSEVICDLLVGADGAWSKVRSLVSSAKPTFTGITGVEISLTPETVAAHPEIADRVGKGHLFALQDNKALIAQFNTGGRIRTYALFKGPADFVLPNEPSAGKELLLSHYEGWAPWLRDLIISADPLAMYTRPLYILPTDHYWENVPGVTLLGDAAHLMTPFAGEGANQAMQDATDLALGLACTKPSEWDKSIRKLEQRMFRRSKPFAEESLRNLDMCMQDDAAENFAKLMTSLMSFESISRIIGFIYSMALRMFWGWYYRLRSKLNRFWS